MPNYLHTKTLISAARDVSEHAKHVRIESAGIRHFIADNHASIKEFSDSSMKGYPGYEMKGLDDEQRLNVALALNSINFNYWSGYWFAKRYWNFSSNGTRKIGSSAVTLAFKTAMEKGTPIYDAKFLSQLMEAQLSAVLGDGGRIPMFKRRLAILKEDGKALTDKYDGKFSNLLRREHDAVELVNRIATDFPSFLDYGYYPKHRRNHNPDHVLYFMKRAQLLVWDVSRNFPEFGITGTDRLTAFADYKVPMDLRRNGEITYSRTMAWLVDTDSPIRCNSRAYVENRAVSLTAIEVEKEELRSKYGIDVPSALLDCWHWLRMHSLPVGNGHHVRVRTTAC